MSTHSMPRNKNVTFYCICGRARNGKIPCEHTRYHRAVNLEERVRAFTVSLLKRPEVIREQAKAFIETERRRFRDPDGQIRSLLEHLDRIERKQRGYGEQNAEGLIPLDELKAVLSDLENQKKAATEELAVLRDRETFLADLEKMARDFILDLPY